MPAIIAAIVGFFVRYIAAKVAFWLVVKAAILFFGIFIFPVIMYNFLTGIIEEYMAYVTQAIQTAGGDGLAPQLVSLSGIGAWMALHLKIPQCVTLIVSAIKMRLLLLMIPGMK